MYFTKAYVPSAFASCRHRSSFVTKSKLEICVDTCKRPLQRSCRNTNTSTATSTVVTARYTDTEQLLGRQCAMRGSGAPPQTAARTVAASNSRPSEFGAVKTTATGKLARLAPPARARAVPRAPPQRVGDPTGGLPGRREKNPKVHAPL
jgi:hypothetical protein